MRKLAMNLFLDTYDAVTFECLTKKRVSILKIGSLLSG